jgi:histone H3/H4
MTKTSVLPAPRIMQRIKKEISQKRVSPAVALYTTAAIEEIVTSVLKSCHAETKASKKKKVTRECLLKVVRTDASVKRLFASFAFAPMQSIKYTSTDFLTKQDREKTMLKSKGDETPKKSKQKAPPEVDDDDDEEEN